MKKFSTSTFLIIVLGAIAESFFPWWSVVVVAAFVAFLFNEKSAAAFAGGFLAVGILWFAYAFILDLQSHSILTPKIVEMLQLSSKNHLYVFTALIGSIAGGMGALTGNLFRKLFVKEKSDYFR